MQQIRIYGLKKPIGIISPTLCILTCNNQAYSELFVKVGIGNMHLSQFKSIMEQEEEKESKREWFVMRDLHRGHRAHLSYQLLAEKGYSTYTPIVKTIVRDKTRKAYIVERPYLPDLFFLNAQRSQLIALTNEPKCNFQFRYRYGVSPPAPMVVPDKQMDDFIRANKESEETRFFPVTDIPKSARNSPIRIIGGPLDGLEGLLLRTRGTKRKQLIIELPHFLAISVYVKDEYIEFL